MKAVIYAAKSTADLKGSIPTQLDDGRRLAEEKGHEVVGEFKDEAKSAFHGSRGQGLTDAMAMCEQLAAEDGGAVLVVQHSDRLARGDGKQARHLVEFTLWGLKTGVTILSVQDPGHVPGGRLRASDGGCGRSPATMRTVDGRGWLLLLG